MKKGKEKRNNTWPLLNGCLGKNFHGRKRQRNFEYAIANYWDIHSINIQCKDWNIFVKFALNSSINLYRKVQIDCAFFS